METRQRRVLDSFERVRTFLAEHPASGTLTYASAREMLEDVITRLRALASTQYLGRAQSRAETRRQADRADALLSEFIRPIVTIARAQLEPTSDVGLPAGLRMPKLPLNPSQLRTVCDGMMEAAREHEALLIANGLPADFLAQFATACVALDRCTNGRAAQRDAHVAARKGLAVQLQRGRRAVERLDAIVRAAFRRDSATLGAWRVAKRLQRTPGGRSVRETGSESEALRAA